MAYKRIVKERKDSILHLMKIIVRPILYPFFQIKTCGADNIPKDSAFILLPKHQRWEDIPLLGLATPRPLYYIAKDELFLNPLSGWFFSSLGGIPLNRKRPLKSRSSLRMMMQFLKKSEGLVIFPEGTYFRGRVGPGHAGLIRMIRSRVGLPFIPVGLRYSNRKIRSVVNINYGEPIYENNDKGNQAFINNIMKEVARLSGF